MQWNDGNSDNPRTVTLTQAATYTATFAINTYTLTLATNGSGSVTLPNPLPDGVTGSNGTYTVNHGTQVTVTATPATHHYMQKWDDEDPINSNVPVNKTVTVTENTALTAYFAQKPILTLSTNPSDPIRGYVTIAGTTLPNYVAQIGTSSSYYVDYDSSVTVKATPIDHYHLASWNNTSGNALQQVVTMTADMEITGVFAIDTFTLTLKTNDIAMGKAEVTNHSGNPAIVSHGTDANGTSTYKVNYGAEVIIKATPENHYHLESWSNGATVNPEDTIHVIVTDNSTITANFAINTYTIAATVNPTEGGTVSGAGSYTHGASCTLTATPATGYHFVNWTDGNEVVSTNATYAFTVNGTRSLVANFSLNTYAITANANPTEGGTVSGADSYTHGATATLTASANVGYTFVNWTKNGNVVSTNATYSFTATEAADYVANFTLNSYTITVTANPTAGGTLTGAGSYNHGTICTLTATANEGYAFSKWTENGDEVSTDATYSFTVTGARNLVAVFDTLTYSIAVTADPAEGGTITGTGIYKHFETCTLTATPTTGYHFVNWTENDTVVANAGAEYTFTVTGARNLMANFDTTHANLAWSAEEFTGYVAIDFNNWKPTLSNPNSVNVRYGCVEGNDPDNGGIAVDASTGTIGDEMNFGHATLKSGTFHIYAVHETDQGHYYDSVVYTLHVLPSAFVGLTPNIPEAGTVSMPNATNVPSLTHHYATVGNLPTVIMALNESVDILAEPATGYHFNYWQIPLVPQEEATTAAYTYQFTIPIAVNFQINLLTRTLRAIFDTNTYALNVVSANLEMGSGNGGNLAAKHFLNYEISASPNTGYHFVKWNDGNTANPRTVTLISDSTFTAIFAPDTFTITYMDGETELNVDTFYYHQPITDYTVSKVGWDFLGWSPEVPEVMPAGNLTVYAQWYRICDSVTDVDHNTYPSVNINNKCWMAANLRTTHYADGRAIPNVYEYQSTLYPNVTENVNLAGRLYDWYAAMDVENPTKAASIQGICPNDWRMPTAEDAALLNAVPATELRTTTGWVSPNYNTNSTGFSAYPAGFYNSTLGRFEGMGTETDWWMVNGASVYGTTSAGGTTSSIQIPYYCDTYLSVTRDPKDAISVRCVKD